MNCQQAKSLLTEYIDDTLSARLTWELDKHLADCNDCTRLLNETRRTVALLAGAPRFEVSDDFVASLNARVATVEQEPGRQAWTENLRALFRPRVRPLWGVAVAACGLALIVVFQYAPQNKPPMPSATAADSRLVQAAQTQSIAIIATDPFGDTAAASVAANPAAYSAPRGSTSDSSTSDSVF